MALVNRLQSLWNILTVPHAADEDQARQEYMTKAVLVMMGVTFLVFTLPTIVGWSTGLFQLESVIIMLLMDLPVGGGWWLAQR